MHIKRPKMVIFIGECPYKESQKENAHKLYKESQIVNVYYKLVYALSSYWIH